MGSSGVAIEVGRTGRECLATIFDALQPEQAIPHQWTEECQQMGAPRARLTLRSAMDLRRLDPAMRLAISVIQRCVDGEGVPLVQRTLTHYEPTLHLCHDNVRQWVKLFPKYTHVYGFFVADRRPISDGTLVIAHSAVGAPDGSLNDITPSELDVAHPFVRHTGTPEEFDLIAAVEPFTLEVPRSLLRQFLRVPR